MKSSQGNYEDRLAEELIKIAQLSFTHTGRRTNKQSSEAPALMPLTSQER